MSNFVTVVDFQADMERPFPIKLRDLYSGLEVEGDFSSWAKDQITRAQLIENTDYLIFMEKNENSKQAKKRGRPAKEYYITLNAAQHVAMMSNTAKGYAYRQRFIDLEKHLGKDGGSLAIRDQHARQRSLDIADGVVKSMMSICSMFSVPLHLAQIEAAKEAKKITGIDLSPLLLSSPAQNAIKPAEVMLEPTEVGRTLGLGSGTAANKWLHGHGLQVKIAGEWVPTEKAMGMYSKHAWTKGTKSGYNLKWNVERLGELF